MRFVSPSIVSSFWAGLIFSVWLALSGMTNPQKVLGFLNLFGSWDPSLLFVMGGALLISWIGHRILSRRKAPLFDAQWHFSWNSKGLLDAKLLVGSMLFGIGWGISGLCPGPAIANVLEWNLSIWLFLGALLLSAGITQKLLSRS